jgi:predicted DNA-binding WGR domain protein
MPAPLVSLNEARALYGKRAFRVRFEFRGYNDANESGSSSKFWEFESEFGFNPCVTVRWGKIGSKGQSQFKSLHDAMEKAHEKMGKGYRMVRPPAPPAPKPAPVVVAPKPAAPTPLAGIFASIHRLTKKATDCYGAFNRSGELLFDVTEAGFRELIKANPMIAITS